MRKHICIRNKVCPFYNEDIGVKTWNQARVRKLYMCSLGLFKLTDKIKRLPKHCDHKAHKTRKLRQIYAKDRRISERAAEVVCT